jgi:regulatory protein
MPAGTITALRPQEHDSQRVNLYIDHAFALGVSLNTVAREELYVGKQLDAAAWAKLETRESADKALHAALRFIQARPRSAAEVRERLRRKQFASDAIERAISRLSELELLDDVAFARFWVENRNACRPRGQQALRSELSQKGISRETIDAVLADTTPDDEHTRALTLARGVLPRYASADYATFQRRLGGYLQRRGFGYDIVRAVLSTLWEESQAAAAADD